MADKITVADNSTLSEALNGKFFTATQVGNLYLDTRSKINVIEAQNSYLSSVVVTVNDIATDAEVEAELGIS